MKTLRRWWTSEDSRIALRLKQLITSALPDSLLIAAKKRYYYWLLNTAGGSVGERDMRALPRLVKRGDFVIDIGTNIGIYTKRLASLVGDNGLVWSFEPVPQTFEILSYLIKKNVLTNVKPFNVAISDESGSVEMEIPRWKGGGESWYDARIFSADTRHANWRTVKAQRATLDSLTANTDRAVSFVKCDAEFHEMACLRGARETIAKWHPSWLIETLDNHYSHKSDTENIVSFLSAFGYKAYLFDGQNFRPRPPNEKSQNTFFFSDGQAPATTALSP